MKRIILSITENMNKLEEQKKIFSEYGIEVIQVKFNSDDPVNFIKSYQTDERKVIAAVRETSDLFQATDDVESREIASKIHLERVINTSKLQVIWLGDDDVLNYNNYAYEVPGFINLSLKCEEEDVFGWDDIFVVQSILLTYHQMKKKGLKVSARDMVFGEFIKDFIHYKKRIDLNFEPKNSEQTIDFSKSVITHVQNNKYWTLPNMSKYKLDVLMVHVLNSGLFFKSPKNRKEKNYWLPSLNAGVPLVPKKDELHEVTFATHDLFHFLIPDLLYTGEEHPIHEKIYIIYRMLSEAFTLVLADMLFIDVLKKSGVDYDYSKRAIYPVFEEMNLDFEQDFKGSLEAILYANTAFALSGDTKPYEVLLKGSERKDEVLEAFTFKYKPFFVEDYKWTAQNYHNMKKESKTLKSWFSKNVSLLHRLNIENITSFTNKICEKTKLVEDELMKFENEQLIYLVFEEVFEQLMNKINNPLSLDQEKAYEKSVQKYMLGQMVIFSKFDFVPDSPYYEELIKKEIKWGVSDVQNIQNFYAHYIDELWKKNLLSYDDRNTFRELYTIFPPFYVSYDKDKSEYESIEEIRDFVLR